MKKLFFLLLSLWLIPSIALSIGISYEDETSYSDMRGSFYDGQSWWCGQILGAELLSNSDFSAWTGDNPDSWTVNEEDANNTISEHADGARLVSNNTTNLNMVQIKTVTALSYYRVQITISNYVEGEGKIGIYNNTSPSWISTYENMGWVANGTYSYYFQVPSGCTSVRIYIGRASDMSTDLVYSLCSLKQVTSPNTQPGVVSNGDLIVLDDSAGKYAYGYVKLGAYNQLVSPLFGGRETRSALANNITAITKANPGVVASVAHGLHIGELVFFKGLTEMMELNNTYKTVTAVGDADHFSINDTSAYGANETTGGACGWEITIPPPVLASQIYKERGLVNQGWFKIDAGFNYNADTAFDFDIYRHPGSKQNW